MKDLLNGIITLYIIKIIWSLMSSDTANRGPYKCQHCGKTFNTQDELDKHERSDASGGNLK